MRNDNPAQIIRARLWVNLVAGFVLYVTYYRQLQGALKIIRDITPTIIFVAGAVLIYSHDRSAIRRRRIHNEEYETVTLSYWDALLSDVVAFMTAAAILALPAWLDERGLNVVDLLQAGLAFTALVYVRNYYFGKIGK